jgi:hypothetical protein
MAQSLKQQPQGRPKRNSEAVSEVIFAVSGHLHVDCKHERVETSRADAIDHRFDSVSFSGQAGLKPVGPAFAGDPLQWCDRGRADNHRMFWAAAARASTMSPSKVVRPAKPIGEMPNGDR